MNGGVHVLAQRLGVVLGSLALLAVGVVSTPGVAAAQSESQHSLSSSTLNPWVLV